MRQFLKLIWKLKHAGPKSSLEETIDFFSITIPEVDINSSAIILLTNTANENCIAAANTASCINNNIDKRNDHSALSMFFVPPIHVFMSLRR